MRRHRVTSGFLLLFDISVQFLEESRNSRAKAGVLLREQHGHLIFATFHGGLSAQGVPGIQKRADVRSVHEKISDSCSKRFGTNQGRYGQRFLEIL